MTQKYFINLKKKDAKFELNKDNPYLSRFNYILLVNIIIALYYTPMKIIKLKQLRRNLK